MNSRNHTEMQKYAIFVKKDLKINMLKVKNIAKDHCHYKGEYTGAEDNICKLKYSVPKKFL